MKGETSNKKHLNSGPLSLSFVVDLKKVGNSTRVDLVTEIFMAWLEGSQIGLMWKCESESVKVWKWKCESESVKVKVWKWKCESESVKVKVW